MSKKKKKKKETSQIEMMFHITSRKIKIHNHNIIDWQVLFQLNIDIQKVEKDALLTVPDLKYKTLV